ncbi:unnamed protein product [Urochloa humidicola]
MVRDDGGRGWSCCWCQHCIYLQPCKLLSKVTTVAAIQEPASEQSRLVRLHRRGGVHPALVVVGPHKWPVQAVAVVLFRRRRPHGHMGDQHSPSLRSSRRSGKSKSNN